MIKCLNTMHSDGAGPTEAAVGRSEEGRLQEEGGAPAGERRPRPNKERDTGTSASLPPLRIHGIKEQVEVRQWIQIHVLKEQVGDRQYRDRSLRSR